MKKDDQLDFFADAVIAQEIAVTALLGALFKFHPEIAESFITSLEQTLINRQLPSAGVKNNLNALVAFARANQPKPATEH